MKDNKGITLIELIVTLALAGIILSIVMSFFIMNVKSYETINYESDVKYQSQSAINYMTSKILEAKKFNGLVNDIYEFEHDNGVTFGFRKVDKLIEYYEDTKYIIDTNTYKFGKYVKQFHINIGSRNSEVIITLELIKDKKDSSGDTYKKTQTVHMRNYKEPESEG